MSKGNLPLTNWSNTQLTFLLIIALLTGGC